MNIDKKEIERIAKSQPVITHQTATYGLKGYSSCKYCGNQGYFLFSGEREWRHSESCI